LKRKTKLGKIGEDISTRYLLHKGYKILERNWRFEKKEIDIIAKDGNTLVMVEVKTRTDPEIERLDDLVDRRKQKFLIDATDAYIRDFNVNENVRFDIILVSFSGEKPVIEHIDDAFYPSY